MAPRKSDRRPSTDQRRKPRRKSATRQRNADYVAGELPFIRETAASAGKATQEAAQNYAATLDDIAAQARRNVTATLTLGIAAGLFATRFARQWSTIRRGR